MELKDIRSFQHCLPDKNILCINLPATCPLCFQPLSDCTFLVPPFCIPNPFHYHISTLLQWNHTSSASPIQNGSVVVIPTNGTFINGYVAGNDLHVGLTNSFGEVFSFSEQGVTKELYGWDCCLCVQMLSDHDEEATKQWDDELMNTLHDNKWSKVMYDESSYNCYDYVISLLSNISQASLSKETFCSNDILPVTTRAAKYINLLHELHENEVVVKKCE